jgi:EAL domain-containing protein (putative c-di-GMP-specific phosphodiesterase class I)
MTLPPAGDLGRLVERVIAHYQPIVEIGTGKVAGFEMLARIPDDAAPARSIGPLIEAIESDPVHLEPLMWRLLNAIQRDAQPLFARFPDFFVSVNVPPVMIGNGKILAMIDELAGLEQLRGQTFDLLRIDHSQVEHLLKDPTADRRVRGIVALASVLRARTAGDRRRFRRPAARAACAAARQRALNPELIRVDQGPMAKRGSTPNNRRR